MESQEISNSQKILTKKNKAGGLTLFQNLLENYSIQNSVALA